MCGAPKLRKKIATKEKVKMDFRRADPKYVNFVPKTCVDAIDLFNRHRNLGLTADMFPECFVHCSRSLPHEELDKFHRFIICPSGDVDKGGEKPTVVDQQLEDERRQLERECTLREFNSQREVPSLERLQALRIVEEEPDEQPMSQDDEKCPMSVSEDSQREVPSLDGALPHLPSTAGLESLQSYTKPMSDDENYITVSQR